MEYALGEAFPSILLKLCLAERVVVPSRALHGQRTSGAVYVKGCACSYIELVSADVLQRVGDTFNIFLRFGCAEFLESLDHQIYVAPKDSVFPLISLVARYDTDTP